VLSRLSSYNPSHLFCNATSERWRIFTPNSFSSPLGAHDARPEQSALPPLRFRRPLLNRNPMLDWQYWRPSDAARQEIPPYPTLGPWIQKIRTAAALHLNNSPLNGQRLLFLKRLISSLQKSLDPLLRLRTTPHPDLTTALCMQLNFKQL